MKNIFIWQFLLAVLLITFPAFAAESPTITLEEAISAGMEKSDPALEGMKSQAERRAEATEATTIDNPELQVDLTRDKSQSGTGVAAEAFQPLKLSQFSGGRSRYADSLRKLADGERKIQDLKTISDISTAYLKLWTLQAREDLYKRSLQDSKKLSSIVGKSTQAGQTARAAQELFSGDNELLSSEIKAIDAEMIDASLELSHLTGLSLTDKKLQHPQFTPVPATADALIALASQRSTWRSVLRDRVDTAERRLSVAQTDGVLPEFGPRLIYSRDPTGDQQAVGIGVALRIPLWNQNDAEKERARAEVNYARTTNDRYQQLPPSETIRALHRIALTREERQDSLQNAVLPRYRKSYELTQAMFRQGQADAIALWQVREKLYQTEETALNAVVDSYIARLKLEAEVGGKLEEVK